MQVFLELEHLAETFKEVNFKVTLSEKEQEQVLPALAVLQVALERKLKAIRYRELEEDFLKMLSALETDDKKKAFELFKKGRD